MRFLSFVITITFLAFFIPAQGAPPLWWSQGNPPPVDATLIPDHHGVANIGQAKWMAKCALLNLRATVPQIADQVEGDLVGVGKPISSWNAPTTEAERISQKEPLLIGQLKAITAPFYHRIHATASPWLVTERLANLMPDNGSFYPWTTTLTDDSNRSPATVGALKAVFSLRFSESNDGDTISDLYEYYHFGSTNSGLEGATPLDLDRDGWLDPSELSGGGDIARKDNPKLLLQVSY